ncbi:MAG: hypothetical protein CVU69_05645 [Deltaproteobacteria bacterium HGW-Deltaproteobacteria-4]|nr:MAG: hypothetical protein CVU69_05645 [Deltaproteobacteria bacterium HGW-Deltaproteobacteria-4]
MTIRFLFFIMILMIFSAPNASAANEGFFLLANFRQSAHLSYKFDRYQLETSTSSRHTAYEDYSFKGDYAILDPGLLNGNFTLGFRLKQNYYPDSLYNRSFSVDRGIFYDIRGVFAEKSAYPLGFFLNSKLEEIADGFGRNYQLDTRNWGLNQTLKSNFLPSTVTFIRTENETEGLAVDRQSTQDNLTFSVKHNLRISETNFEVLFSREDFAAPGINEKGFRKSSEFNLHNKLDWQDGDKTRNLSSILKYWQSIGLNDRTSFTWSENLYWDLGKALRSGLSYGFSDSESGPNQRQSNTGRAWLRHELYKSLTTNLEGSAREVRFFPGSEQQLGAQASLGYRKILPAQSLLSANIHSQYQISERDFAAARLTFFDELHTVSFTEPLFLENPDVIPGSVVIWNQNPAIQVTPYIEEVDFRLIQSGDQTEIVVSGFDLSNIIPEGTILSISYDVVVDPDVKFESKSWGTDAQLRLWENRFRFYGSYDQSKNTMLSGERSKVGLENLRTIFRLGAEAKTRGYTLSGEYVNTDSVTTRSQSLIGRLHYAGEWQNGKTTFYLENRFWWYDVAAGQRAIEDRNTLKIGGNYRKTIFGNVVFSTWGSYLTSMGSVDSQLVNLGGDVRWQYRNLVFALRAWSGYRRFSGDWASEEHLRFDLTRYF